MDEKKENKLYGNDDEEQLVSSIVFDDASNGDIFINLGDDGDADVKVYQPKNRTRDIVSEDSLDEITDDGDDELADRTIDKRATEESVDEAFDEQFFENVYSKKISRKNVATIAFISILIIIMIIFTAIFVKNSTIGTNTVYSGVLVNGYNLGGMTKKQVVKYIEDTYFTPISNAKITVVLGDSQKVYPLTDFVVCPNADTIAEKAYNIGRTGTDSERVSKVRALKDKPESILIEYELVTEKLNEIIEGAENKGFIPVVDPTYDVRDDGVVFTSGRNGMAADVARFKSDINDVLKDFEEAIVNIETEDVIKDATIVIGLVETHFKTLDKSEILSATFRSSSGAIYQRNGSTLRDPITVAPGMKGRTLNNDKLDDIITKINSGENIPYFMLEYDYISPEDTMDLLREKLYKDVLAEVVYTNSADNYSDDEATGIEERGVNIERCAELLGTIELLGGEEVNIADFIKEISEARGFVKAYENLVDGGRKVVGGGSAEFTTALYEAALLSGLRVSNVNHNPYLPCFGIPGAESMYNKEYGLTIKNTTGNPIKIVARYENATLFVYVIGLKSDITNGKITYVLNEKRTSGDDNYYKYTAKRQIGVTEETLAVVEYKAVKQAASEATPEPTAEPTPQPTAEPTAEPPEPTTIPEE